MVHKLRSSKMDAMFACPASVLCSDETLMRIEPWDDGPARLGRAIHEMAGQYSVHGEYSIDDAVVKHDLDESQREEAVILMAFVRRQWGLLEPYFKTPLPERSVIGPELTVGGKTYQVTGTIDLVSPTEKENGAIFLDWKSGRLDSGYREQMNCYAYLLWCHMGRPETCNIKGVVIPLRQQCRRVYEWNPGDLEAWEHELVHNVLPNADSFHVGKACTYCSLNVSCPARQRYSASIIHDVVDVPSDENRWHKAVEIMTQLTEHNKDTPLVSELINDMLVRCRMLQGAIDNAKALLKDAVQRVGPIPLDNSTQLALKEVQRKSLEPLETLQIARIYLSDNQIGQCMNIKLQDLLDAYAEVKKSKENKTKKELRQEMLDILTAKGAVIVKTHYRLTEEEITPDTKTLPESENENEEH